jgi:hypothetical protein
LYELDLLLFVLCPFCYQRNNKVFCAGEAGAIHDWTELRVKFEDIPPSLGVPDEIRETLIGKLQHNAQLENIKAMWMDKLRGGCA